jgi:hypothetical protein
MSSDKTETRSRTWHFSHTLYTSVKPDAARGLCPTSSIGPWDFIKSMLDELFKHGPQTVLYIHLRVSRAAFDRCVACGRSGTALPNLPFTGFIQAGSTVRLSLLQAWLDAVWTPVGSKFKLCSAPLYRNEFMVQAKQSKRSRCNDASCTTKHRLGTTACTQRPIWRLPPIPGASRCRDRCWAARCRADLA